MCLVRTSYLLLYRTLIFPRYQKTLLVLLCANGLGVLVMVVVWLAHCTPVQKVWQPSVDGHCLDDAQVFISTGALNMLGDFIILGLPLPFIWQMQLALRQKLEILVLLLLGGLYDEHTPYCLLAGRWLIQTFPARA